MSTANRRFEFLLSEKYHGDDPRSLSPDALWHGFMDHTTAHGISHWNNARGILKKFYWLFFSLCSLAAMCYYGYGIVAKFMDFPVTVTVSVSHEPELVFPAITFCNSNPVLASSIKNNSDLSSLFGGDSDVTENSTLIDTGGEESTTGSAGGLMAGAGVGSKDTVIDGTEPLGGAPPTTRRRKKRQVPEDERRVLESNDAKKPMGMQTDGKGRAIKADFALGLQFQQYIAELPVEEKAAMGHSVDAFILQCHYGGYTCNSSDFYAFYNTKYGNCFAFNSGWGSTAEDLEISRTPGPEYGLEVVFNIDQEEYIGDFTSVAGVRLVVHDQSSMPFPEDEGITFQPGALTFVGLRKETITRKSHPYGNCTDISDEGSPYSNVYEEFFPVSYTTKACLKTCIQKNNIETCGCADSKYPTYGEAFDNKRVPICDLTNDTESVCVEDILELYKHDQLDCECPTACSESVYTTEISSGLWPASQYRVGLFSDLAQTNDKAKEVIKDGTYQENFAKVIVYYEEFNLEAIEEIPSYQAGQFVSDIGGILGLFIGFSLLTIMEFVELVLDLILHAISSTASSHKDIGKAKKTQVKAKEVIKDGTYQENFAKVIVYYEEFNLEAIEEIPSYQAGQFVSDIGGIPGLFIGFSLLTIMEFVELVLDLMVLCYYRNCGKSPTAPSTSGDPAKSGEEDRGQAVRGAWSAPPGYSSPLDNSATQQTPVQKYK